MKLFPTSTCAIALALTLASATAQSLTSQSPKEQFRVTIENGYVTVSRAKSGEFMGGISVNKWKLQGGCTENRHMALDIAAAAVEGGGGREHTVGPDLAVYTLADAKLKNVLPTATEEHGHLFVIAEDNTGKGRYTALVYELNR